jgi:RND family efflux transporter MFP subunit
LVPILVLVLAAAGFVALRATRAQRPPIVVEEKSYPVEVMAAEPTRRAPELQLYGRVESPRTTTLTAAVTADVMAVPAREGQRVDAEELLVRLDDRDIKYLLAQREADVSEVKAQIVSEHSRFRADQETLELEERVLGLSRSEVKRLESLQGRGLSSESLRDQARQALEVQAMAVIKRKQAIEDHDARLASLQARLARAQALRDQAALDLDRTEVTAPFVGRVTRVEVSPGDRVVAGSTLVEVFDSDAVELRAQIPSRQLPEVRPAVASNTQVVAVAKVDGQTVELELDRLAARADPASGGVDALFRVVSGGEHLTIGRIVPLALRLPARESLIALPYEALYGLDHVYIIEDQRMRRVNVDRVGETRSGRRPQVLVRSANLPAGAEVIVTQLPNAVDGLLVEVTGGRSSGS